MAEEENTLEDEATIEPEIIESLQWHKYRDEKRHKKLYIEKVTFTRLKNEGTLQEQVKKAYKRGDGIFCCRRNVIQLQQNLFNIPFFNYFYRLFSFCDFLRYFGMKLAVECCQRCWKFMAAASNHCHIFVPTHSVILSLSLSLSFSFSSPTSSTPKTERTEHKGTISPHSQLCRFCRQIFFREISSLYHYLV